MLYWISVTERGLTGIANIFRSRLSRLDDLLGAGTVPLKGAGTHLTLSAAAGLAPSPGVSARVTSGETSTPGVTDRGRNCFARRRFSFLAITFSLVYFGSRVARDQ